MSTYRFIQAESANFPIAFSCRVLGVSRSAFYGWVREEESDRAREDRVLAAEIRAIHRVHKGRYGSPRIHRELRTNGRRVGRKRVARLMRQEGIHGRVRRRFRRTTDSRKTKRVAPNLLERNFNADMPNRVWVGDATYIPTTEGWLYLAVLIDLFSRRVVGWAMSDRIETELFLRALEMAIKNRHPEAGLIHHTDRDSRYASDEYLAALANAQMVPSMSRKADCWDNAVAESFFATLEKELLGLGPIIGREGTRRAVEGFIERYYNERRMHSYLDYASPIAYEACAIAAS